jgi:hypothetical protein
MIENRLIWLEAVLKSEGGYALRRFRGGEAFGK